jgi:hypothetical protein
MVTFNTLLTRHVCGRLYAQRAPAPSEESAEARAVFAPPMGPMPVRGGGRQQVTRPSLLNPLPYSWDCIPCGDSPGMFRFDIRAFRLPDLYMRVCSHSRRTGCCTGVAGRSCIPCFPTSSALRTCSPRTRESPCHCVFARDSCTCWLRHMRVRGVVVSATGCACSGSAAGAPPCGSSWPRSGATPRSNGGW